MDRGGWHPNQLHTAGGIITHLSGLQHVAGIDVPVTVDPDAPYTSSALVAMFLKIWRSG